MVTVAVVPEFTIEINLATELSVVSVVAKAVQKDLAAPKAWPKST